MRSVTTADDVVLTASACLAGAGVAFIPVADPGLDGTFTLFAGTGVGTGLALAGVLPTDPDFVFAIATRAVDFLVTGAFLLTEDFFAALGALFAGLRPVDAMAFCGFFTEAFRGADFLAATFFTAFFAAGAVFFPLALRARVFPAFPFPA